MEKCRYLLILGQRLGICTMFLHDRVDHVLAPFASLMRMNSKKIIFYSSKCERQDFIAYVCDLKKP